MHDTQLNEFASGQRVATHPATEAFMRGERYGVVRSVGRKFVSVMMDNGHRRRFDPLLLTVISVEARADEPMLESA